jgi:tetratricopeptide (TPR) repeat protein
MENGLIKGIELYNQYQLDEAQLVLEELVLSHPELTEGWFYLGKICQRTQDYGKALNYFQKTIEIAPGHEGATIGIRLIQDILKLTNNFYFENAYTDEGLYHTDD